MNITFSEYDIYNSIKVLNNEYENIPNIIKEKTQEFINNYSGNYFDLRNAYNNVVNYLFDKPDQLIYFIREITLNRICIRYNKVPEFRIVVNVYSQFVQECRRRM